MVALYREGVAEESDTAELTIPPGEDRSAIFELGAVDPCVLRAKLDVEDGLAGDNEASAIVNPPRAASVLLVTPGPFQMLTRAMARPSPEGFRDSLRGRPPGRPGYRRCRGCRRR